MHYLSSVAQLDEKSSPFLKKLWFLLVTAPNHNKCFIEKKNMNLKKDGMMLY